MPTKVHFIRRDSEGNRIVAIQQTSPTAQTRTHGASFWILAVLIVAGVSCVVFISVFGVLWLLQEGSPERSRHGTLDRSSIDGRSLCMQLVDSDRVGEDGSARK